MYEEIGTNALYFTFITGDMAGFTLFDLTNYSWLDWENISYWTYDPCFNRSDVTDWYWSAYHFLDSSYNATITAMVVCQFLISIIGTLWNLLILALILMKQMFNDPTYIFIMNLVIADLLLCGLVLPFNIQSSLNREFSLGQSDYARCQSCQTIGALLVVCIFVSYFTLALLALDRLVYIKWPFKYSRYVSVKLAIVLIIVVVWILNAVLAALPAMGFGDININGLSFCSPVFHFDDHLPDSTHYFILLVLIGLLPFALSLAANIWIICFAYKMAKKNRRARPNVIQNSDLSNTVMSRSLKERIRLATLSGAFLIINTVLLLPFVIVAAMLGSLGTTDISIAAIAVLYLSFVIQSVIHPILETCILGKATKMMYKSLCSCVKKWKDNTSRD